MRTVGFCEIDPYCRSVLAQHWPGIFVHHDVRSLPRVEGVDVISGGVPCQPASIAGKRLGQLDERWLWPAFFEVVQAHSARWVVAENPLGIVSLKPHGLEWICGTFRDLGYDPWPVVISAHNVGAPHLRRRIWIIAHAKCDVIRDKQQWLPGRWQEGIRDEGQTQSFHHGTQEPLADTNGDGFRTGGRQGVHRARAAGLSLHPGGAMAEPSNPGLPFPEHEELREAWGRVEGGAVTQRGWWASEPDVGRMAHGVPSRVDRLKSLGNAVVPQISEIIGRAIMQVANPGCSLGFDGETPGHSLGLHTQVRSRDESE